MGYREDRDVVGAAHTASHPGGDGGLVKSVQQLRPAPFAWF